MSADMALMPSTLVSIADNLEYMSSSTAVDLLISFRIALDIAEQCSAQSAICEDIANDNVVSAYIALVVSV